MVNRPENTFNRQSLEVLKGPASILYGRSAVGGALNVMTKQLVFGPTAVNCTNAVNNAAPSLN